MRIEKILCLISALSFFGCSTVFTMGSGGSTAQTVVGPVVLEARTGKKVLAKYRKGNKVFVVGNAGDAFSLRLRNRTDEYWQMTSTMDSGSPLGRHLIMGPYLHLSIDKMNPQEQAYMTFPMPGETPSLKVLRLSLFRGTKTDLPFGEYLRGKKYRLSQATSENITLTFGACDAYRKRQMLSHMCPAPKHKLQMPKTDMPPNLFKSQ